MADKKISALTGATTPLAGTEVLPIVQGGSTVKVSVDNLTVGKTVTTGDVISVKTSAGAVTDVITVQNLNSTAGTEAGIFFSPTAATGNIRGARITGINDGGNVIGLKFYTGTGAAITSKFEMTADGNLAVSTAGKGIDFSANTHAAGMTSELLNDYEEGTFTPVLSSSGTPPTVTSYLAQYGSYTKIGNRVLVTVQIRATISAVGTGYPVVTGLPYAANANCNNGPAWGLAPLINIGISGNFISGTTVQMAFSSYNATTDYLSFSIMYEI